MERSRRLALSALAVLVLLAGPRCGSGSSGGGGGSPGVYQPPAPTPPALQAPSGLAAALTTSTSVTLTWNDNSVDEQQFQIERSVNYASFAALGTTLSNVETYVDGGVTQGSTYQYRIRAYNLSGYSSWSNTAAVSPQEEALNAWRTMGGDARHTGHNSVETGTPPLTADWSVNLGTGGLNQAVIENGRVFVSRSTINGSTAPVWGLNASTGAELWSYNFGSSIFSVGFPGLGGGLVYVPQCDHTPGTYMWAFDPATGGVTWSTPVSAQWSQYWSPVYASGSLWSNGGYYGGAYGFNVSNGAQLFFNDDLEQYDEWSPAYDNGTVYTFVAGNFRAHHPSTGAIQWTRSVGWNWAGWSMRSSPVIAGTHALVIAPPNLHAINLSTQATEWSANGSFTGTPAVANGVVYAISGGTLQARALSGLGLSWSFSGDSALSFPPVIAAGYVYVSSPSNVYAVNASTGQQVWTAAVGGWLSIAEGRLFVARPNGTLQTFTLTP